MSVSGPEAAFALSLAKDTSVDTTLLGVASTLASLVTPLVGILLTDCVVRLVRAGDRGAAALPSFDDLTGMAVDGARLSATLIALQPPAVGLVTISPPGSRPSIAMLSYATNPVMLGSFDVTAPNTTGLVAADFASLLGSYLLLMTTVALVREMSLTVVIPATRDLVSDCPSVRVAPAVVLIVFVTRLPVALYVVVPVAGTLLTATASSLLLAVSAALLGHSTSGASSSDADATRESRTSGVNAESTESTESISSA